MSTYDDIVPTRATNPVTPSKRKLRDDADATEVPATPNSAKPVNSGNNNNNNSSAKKRNEVSIEPHPDNEDEENFLQYFCPEVDEDDTTATLSSTTLTQEDGKDTSHAVVSTADKLWDALPQRLTYAFVGRFKGNKIQQLKFHKFATEWERYANVSFERVEDVEDALIRVSFNPNDGSWSYVGNGCLKAKPTDGDDNDLPTLNLGEVDGTQATYTKRERATVLHECGHVLGLLHEHQTPALGGTSVKNLEKVYHYYEERGWSRERTKQQVIDVINKSSVSNFSQVDPHSIMHYPSSKLITGLPYDVPYNTELSEMDKAYIVINYPRSKPHPDAPEWTLEHALKVAGVPDGVKQEIMDLAEASRDNETGQIDPQEIRAAFTAYTTQQRAKELKQTRVKEAFSPARDSSRPAYANPKGPQEPEPAFGPPKLPGDEANAPDASDAPSESFIEILYKKLNEKFGPKGGTQYLALQFPTRYLDKRTYAYSADGIYSQFNKPPVVNEAEFRLTDDLYPVGRVVGGPNGKTLSNAYELVLNNLVPKASDRGARENRELLRQWLLKPTDSANAHYVANTVLKKDGLTDTMLEKQAATGASSGVQVVSGSIGTEIEAMLNGGQKSSTPVSSPSKDSKGAGTARRGRRAPTGDLAVKNLYENGDTLPRLMTRMEFSQSLTKAYLKDKAKYESMRQDLINEAREAKDPKALEKITRILSHVDLAERSELSSKYADSVVRGYSHVVREMLGLIDVKSTAEMLQDAKDSMRESALSSLFTASKVYPVQMLPTDWFEALDTSFTPADLAADYNIIAETIQTKASLIDDLRNQLDLLSFGKQDVVGIQAALDDALQKRDTAQAALTKEYTANMIETVKMCVAVTTNPAVKAKFFTGDEKTFKAISESLTKISDQNNEVNKQNRILTQALAAQARAQSQDTKKEKSFIERQIATAEKELADLRVQYKAAIPPAGIASIPVAIPPTGQVAQPKTDDLTSEAAPEAPSLKDIKVPIKQGGSRWIDIVFESEVENKYSKSASTTVASTSKVECNLWIGSAQGSGNEAQAGDSAASGSSKVKVSIAMRCTLVTVDRSGWFQPQFFESSKAFAKNNKDLSWTSLYKTTADNPKTIIDKIATGTVEEEGSALPAFPIGYIIVKDTQIKVSESKTSTSTSKGSMKEDAARSGGILCFSYSSSETSASDSSASATKQASDGIVVNIPGPQILGYIMQLMPRDLSTKFGDDKEEVYLPPTMEEIDVEKKKGQDRTAGGNHNSGAQYANPKMMFPGKDDAHTADQSAGAIDASDTDDEGDVRNWKDPPFLIRPSLGEKHAGEKTKPTAAAAPKTSDSSNPGKGYAAPSFDDIKPAKATHNDQDIAKLVMHVLTDTDKLVSLLDAEPEKKSAFIAALERLK
ncbi:hypothetical protein A4X13_0g6310 [Tilletia indica]|uniref:Peptidase metallopeptidase domain-containing protein n=1 Tax=Tilletia indica TaxID=43049 RepID=A0A177T6Z5_9BASI|nr:hypothetical protein A4X13_0g6310 [Tilletia indica]